MINWDISVTQFATFKVSILTLSVLLQTEFFRSDSFTKKLQKRFVWCLKPHRSANHQTVLPSSNRYDTYSAWQGPKFYFTKLLFEVKVLEGMRDKLFGLLHGQGIHYWYSVTCPPCPNDIVSRDSGKTTPQISPGLFPYTHTHSTVYFFLLSYPPACLWVDVILQQSDTWCTLSICWFWTSPVYHTHIFSLQPVNKPHSADRPWLKPLWKFKSIISVMPKRQHVWNVVLTSQSDVWVTLQRGHVASSH